MAQIPESAHEIRKRLCEQVPVLIARLSDCHDDSVLEIVHAIISIHDTVRGEEVTYEASYIGK